MNQAPELYQDNKTKQTCLQKFYKAISDAKEKLKDIEDKLEAVDIDPKGENTWDAKFVPRSSTF